MATVGRTWSRGHNSPYLTHVQGPHFEIQFQDGPIGEHGVNGTTNEELLEVLLERLNDLNSGDFRCRENSLAITHIEIGLLFLHRRTELRRRQAVEGLNLPHVS